jgi:hypothetical protein
VRVVYTCMHTCTFLSLSFYFALKSEWSKKTETANKQYKLIVTNRYRYHQAEISKGNITMSTAGGASIPPEQLKARYIGTGKNGIS